MRARPVLLTMAVVLFLGEACSSGYEPPPSVVRFLDALQAGRIEDAYALTGLPAHQAKLSADDGEWGGALTLSHFEREWGGRLRAYELEAAPGVQPMVLLDLESGSRTLHIVGERPYIPTSTVEFDVRCGLVGIFVVPKSCPDVSVITVDGIPVDVSRPRPFTIGFAPYAYLYEEYRLVVLDGARSIRLEAGSERSTEIGVSGRARYVIDDWAQGAVRAEG